VELNSCGSPEERHTAHRLSCLKLQVLLIVTTAESIKEPDFVNSLQVTLFLFKREERRLYVVKERVFAAKPDTMPAYLGPVLRGETMIADFKHNIKRSFLPSLLDTYTRPPVTQCLDILIPLIG
jgi:hypothetical protein